MVQNARFGRHLVLYNLVGFSEDGMMALEASAFCRWGGNFAFLAKNREICTEPRKNIDQIVCTVGVPPPSAFRYARPIWKLPR